MKVGDAPAFNDEMLLGLFRANDNEYLMGGEISPGTFNCYSGNDIPWSEGKLAAICGIVIPASQLQYKMEVGERIRIEISKYRLEHEVKIDKP